MIRKLLNGDIDRVADISLKTNLKAHYFISNQYWKSEGNFQSSAETESNRRFELTELFERGILLVRRARRWN